MVEEISDQQGGLIKDQKVWSPAECVQAMVSSIKILYQRSKVILFYFIFWIHLFLLTRFNTNDNFKELNGEESFLVWDKDDEASMDFVTACSNLRSHVFSIPKKSRFDVKGIYVCILKTIFTKYKVNVTKANVRN